MALWINQDLTGSPTSGTPTTSDLTWATSIAGSGLAFTASTVNGERALSVGPSSSAIEFSYGSKTKIRIRVVAQWSGATQTNHMLWLVVFDAGVNVLGDVQIRNVAGKPIHSRWNFVAGSPTPNWAADTPWRFEWYWEVGVQTILYIWTNPNSTGSPDYTITNAATSGTPSFLRLGNNSATGLTMLMSGIAASDGEAIGPYAPPISGPANLRLDTSFSGDGKSEDTIALAWDPMAAAASYQVERNGVTVASNVLTTTYTDTGLNPTTAYTHRVRATIDPSVPSYFTGGTINNEPSTGIREHKFTSGGTLTWVQGADASIDIQYLVQAGGGGGGGDVGGGGGGGGQKQGSMATYSTQTVTVGAGGVAGKINGGAVTPGQGSSSALGDISAVGGGKGGHNGTNGGAGGSGGGGGGDNSGGPGAGTAGQGKNGGGGAYNGPVGSDSHGGGGGGGGISGVVGTTATTVPGTGGNGTAFNGIPYGAGGGGATAAATVGATGGNGTVGGKGAGTTTAATTPLANRGGGGGGGLDIAPKFSSAGASGVVIVRYPYKAGMVGGTFNEPP